MANKEGQLVAAKIQEQLLSKQAIQLPPKERLQLLLSTSNYPIVPKRTSAEKQIKEMLDFYEFCCLMLMYYFPNEEAEANYIALAMLSEVEKQDLQIPVSSKLSKAFKLVEDYEKFEKKITAVRDLFLQYSIKYPDIYDKYNLEDLVFLSVHDMLENARYIAKENPSKLERILSRWELI